MQKDVDLLIIGSGPAGLSAAQYGARGGLATLAVEQMAVGGQALMIDVLENYPGFVGARSGMLIMEEMHAQAEGFGAEFLFDSVCSLRRDGRFFRAELSSGGSIKAGALILASGAGHRTLNVPGEAEFSGRGVSYCASCDGPFFKNKKIFVVGGGDAACDEARFLSRISGDITMLVRRTEFKAQKALVHRLLKDGSIKTRFCTRVAAIKGEEKVKSLVLEDTETGKTSEEAADAVFVFAGLVPETGLVSGSGAEIQLKLDKSGFIISDQRMESSVKGIFTAGDVRSSPFRQVVTACADGAVAAHSAGEYIQEMTK
ncbi:MAG: FAD-dependent oxidoreductase [Spirochaetaceae bacterium]|jgi:thioredoxin reductase (NADPH)|nr:FAD-dependent oxidoreductase [Spirochaetaceae bacterium]